MQRSLLLDVLRIFAIALVIIAHIGQLLGSNLGDFFGVKNFYYVSLGGVGVSLFIVLSGLLARLSHGSKNEPYFIYLLKKILRIYPLYWLSVPLAMLGYCLHFWIIKEQTPNLFPNGLITDFIGSITGFYSWIGLWGGPYNSPSWFIALIMGLYLIFPPLFAAIKKKPHFTLAILFLISAASRYYIGQEGLPFSNPSTIEKVKIYFYQLYGFMPGRPGDWFILCRVFEFGLGIYISIVLPKKIWFFLKLPKTELINKISDLAFPIFLIHFPYLFLVQWFTELGLPLAFSIFIYLIFIFIVAEVLNTVDQKIPRKEWLNLLQPKNYQGK